MKKILGIFIAVLLFSCQGKKEIELPKAGKTIVADVQEHSPIYIFFKVNGKDTIADVNRKNAISSTNWIFNIDKRLPLKLVIPEVMKLQAKKEGSMHKSEASENYFSYANDVKKTMAFLPFTKVKFKMEKPKSGIPIYFTKKGYVLIDGIDSPKYVLKSYLESSLRKNKAIRFNFCFDKNCSYDRFIKTVVLLNISEVKISNDEVYIF